MKCKQVQELMPELAGGEIGPKEQRECEEHLGACLTCRQRRDEMSGVIGLLRAAGAQQALPVSFSRDLHQRLLREPPPRRPLLARALEWLRLDRAPRIGLLAGALAVALIVFLAAPRRPLPQAKGPREEVAATFQVPSQRIAVMHLDFVTDILVDKVEFEVTLPKELAFIDEGRPLAERTLQWSGSLNAGSNPIPLSISGQKPGRYKVTARARGQGIDVTQDVFLEVVPS